MKERLTRLTTIYRIDAIFFITFCTPDRQKTLANASLHTTFRDFCQRAPERHVLVDRYVIMPDHIHLFVHLSDPSDLPAWIKSLKNSLSKTLRIEGVASPHWQKGYFDHLIRSEDSYESKWTYVRMNPVRMHLVENPEEWSFQGQITPLRFG